MPIVGDIMSLAHEVKCSEFLFVRRETNKVAHTLAHLCSDGETEKIWFSKVPSCCNSLIANDVRHEPTLI
ncbi:hypothetical protein ACS0TY_031968 [Phlomoides rotata]